MGDNVGTEDVGQDVQGTSKGADQRGCRAKEEIARFKALTITGAEYGEEHESAAGRDAGEKKGEEKGPDHDPDDGAACQAQV